MRIVCVTPGGIVDSCSRSARWHLIGAQAWHRPHGDPGRADHGSVYPLAPGSNTQIDDAILPSTALSFCCPALMNPPEVTFTLVPSSKVTVSPNFACWSTGVGAAVVPQWWGSPGRGHRG